MPNYFEMYKLWPGKIWKDAQHNACTYTELNSNNCMSRLLQAGSTNSKQFDLSPYVSRR